MVIALEAMRNTLSFYIGRSLCILFIIVLLFLISYSPKIKKDFSLQAFVFSIIFVIYVLTAVLPFIRDYVSQNIIVEYGQYSNNEQSGGSPSDRLGFMNVTIETKNETISLRTAPGRSNCFEKGNWGVKAYYLPRSKILLHIEILEPVMEGTGLTSP